MPAAAGGRPVSAATARYGSLRLQLSAAGGHLGASSTHLERLPPRCGEARGGAGVASARIAQGRRARTRAAISFGAEVSGHPYGPDCDDFKPDLRPERAVGVRFRRLRYAPSCAGWQSDYLPHGGRLHSGTLMKWPACLQRSESPRRSERCTPRQPLTRVEASP